MAYLRRDILLILMFTIERKFCKILVCLGLEYKKLDAAFGMLSANS